ncbi:MAG: GAF and ANTAR domain-containing protein, partial [Stackebrandtia sp.]
MISVEHLSDVFVEMADTLVAEFDVVDFLHNLTERAATVSGASAVGLLLADQQGRLRYMAASAETAKVLDLFQLQNEEGACLDCFHSHQPVINTDLSEASSRWPAFAPKAADAGFESVHALPMRLRERVIGALNLFGRADVRFEPADVRVVQAIADVATIALLQERSVTRADTVTEQLQAALNSRVVIEQAKGAVAQSIGVGVDEAFELLRAYARSRQQRLTAVCELLL